MSDTGHGMDADTLAHVFEPFFTTKPPGEGTGLGLATVYAVVEQCGGSIEVESVPAQGTSFRILLPRATGDPQPLAPSRQVPSVGGSETLLLVEDDEALRSVTREILETAGYRVLAAAGPPEAVAQSLAYRERIDLLLSDVVMPARSGPELAGELVARRPRMRVLFTSGYARDAIALDAVTKGGTRLVQKPFSASKLLREVRAALDDPART